MEEACEPKSKEEGPCCNTYVICSSRNEQELNLRQSNKSVIANINFHINYTSDNVLMPL